MTKLQCAMALLFTLASAAARAEPLRAAIFGFEFDDTSLQGAMQGVQADEQARIVRLDTQLRDGLSASGKYVSVDVAPVAASAGAQTLRTCDGCEVEFARKLDAQVSVIGWVQKVSNLILNINVVVRDVATGKPARAGSVDIRGDTDESWTRGLRYLLVNRILAEEPPR